MRTFLLVPVLLCVTFAHSFAQCSFPTGIAKGNCNSPSVKNNDNINSGQTLSHSGGAKSFNININGGTLQVCGTLTIQNLNWNGGSIVIMEGGSLTFENGLNINLSSQSITNYGTVTFNSSVNMNGNIINYGTINLKGQLAINNTAAYFVNASNVAVVNATNADFQVNGKLVNLGKIYNRDMTINSGGAICMGPNSEISSRGLTNNVSNGIAVSPSNARACFRYTANALLNNPLTTGPGLGVAKAPGATTSGSSSFGSADVVSNTTNCVTVLPVVLENFTAAVYGKNIRVMWKSSMEENVESYIIEQSTDGNSFSQAAVIPARNMPSTYQYNLPKQTVYLRLRMQDRDGKFAHSKIIYVKSEELGTDQIKLLCSPCYGDQLAVRMITREAQQGRLIITNFAGQVLNQVTVKLEVGQQDIFIPTQGLASGLYTVKFVGNRYSIGPERWMKGK